MVSFPGLDGSERVDVDRPDLGDLTGQLWREMVQVDWRFAVISNPHEVSVDEDGEIVACIVAGSSVTDERCRYEL